MRGMGRSSSLRKVLTGAGVLFLVIGWLAFRTESPPVDQAQPPLLGESNSVPQSVSSPLRDELEQCGTDQTNMQALLAWVRK